MRASTIDRQGSPVPAGSILLVESDGPSAALLSAALTVRGHDVTTVASVEEAAAVAGSHAIVLIDVLPGPRDGIELCRRIRTDPASASTPIIAISGSDDLEERIAFLEAGADDVMSRPFDPPELEVRVEALLVRRDATPVGGFVGERGGGGGGPVRVLTVYSPKGGVGATTIAVNVAVGAALASPGRVLLVDLDVRWGQVATHLNLTTPHTIVDLVHDLPAVKEPGLFRSYTVRHESGLHVLAAPAAAASAEYVAADVVAEALRTASADFDLIVVDAGSELDALSLMALDVADRVVLPVAADIPSLKPVVQLLEYLNETGSVTDKTVVVVNQIFSRQLVGADQIESLLGLPVSARLPYDEDAHLRSTNEGSPVVVRAPRSASAGAFAKLTTALLGPAEAGDRRSGLFRR
jgi:pilus assembly protein CpaE